MQTSIICPVFNTAPSLLTAAASSLLDDRSPFLRQLILVDDASDRPDTLSALDALAAADPRVLLVHAPRNLGPAGARNLGLAAATEEWVGFLDADDVWLPEQPARLRRLAAAHPEASWFGVSHRLIDPNGSWRPARRLTCPVAKSLGGGVLRFEAPALTRILLSDFLLHLGAMVVRRALVKQVGGFAEGLCYFEDFLFMAKLSTLTPLFYLGVDGYGWRRGGESLVTNPRRLDLSSLRMHRIAARDPALRDYRREIRWARYSAIKGLAVNNLLAGRRRRALAIAVRGWTIDPREVRDLLLFLRLWLRGSEEAGAAYSSTERFGARGA
ncbi:glycosyltransferase family 2 protein [Roseococcus pinisoli]|uniref:Glycosyltransferase family 2 protein n=1 Tax=Roseococcus pinisoli TaxID=2835040 RepID=A0ABS5QED5_9PROT|nr:glycosyltransferase family 2 protein [Roseococcus pinisoli]MBS7812031.1 glycosyltransferase family 2 protein [Roseococcus pinisoli]